MREILSELRAQRTALVKSRDITRACIEGDKVVTANLSNLSFSRVKHSNEAVLGLYRAIQVEVMHISSLIAQIEIDIAVEEATVLFDNRYGIGEPPVLTKVEDEPGK